MKIKLMTQKLTRDARMYIQLQVLFGGMSAILILFVNTFLLNAYGSFSKEVLLYNGIMALVQPVAMITAIKLTEYKNALFTQRMGFVFYGLALIILCMRGEAVSPWYPLFAVMLSFGAGYYYSVYSSQMLCYTSDSNRDLIAGMVGLFGSLISILLPLLSGVLISRLGTRTGYQIVFGIAALLAVGALLTNKHLPMIPKHQKEPALRMVCKTIFSNRNGRLIMVANGLCNCRSFTIPIFVTLLFYNLVPDELLISVNSTIGYIVTLLGAGIYGSVVKSKNRVKFSVLAAIMVMLPCLGMMFGLNVILIMVFNAVNGFFNTFLDTPVVNTHFKVIEELDLHSEYGAEVHLIRELFVSAGRILGLILVWGVPQTNAGAVFALISMMMTVVINAAILRRIEKS